MRCRRPPSRGGAATTRVASSRGRINAANVSASCAAEPPAFPPSTQDRSIMTLDGYVSRGHTPHSSVPRDHAMLQDFAAYLEHRVHTHGMPMLRRIFADFLNEHEHTLGEFLKLSIAVISVLPRERTRAQHRKQAAFLLAKPKYTLSPRGCIFLYLDRRVATRHMALFKHLLNEFLCHRETALEAFVARGSDAIAVIPYALPLPGLDPQSLPLPRPQPEPQSVAPAAPEQQQGEAEQQLEDQQLLEDELAFEQMVATLELAEMVASNDDEDSALTRPKKRGRSTLEPARDGATAALVGPLARKSAVSAKRRRETKRQAQAAVEIQVGRNEEEQQDDKKQQHATATSVSVGSCTPKSTPKTAKTTPKTAKTTPKTAKKTTKATERTPKTVAKTTAKTTAKTAKITTSLSKKLPKKARRVRVDVVSLEKRLHMVDRLHELEADTPWKSAFQALPLPLNETRYPQLANQLRHFWRIHGRAVWERNFWAPVTRETSSFEHNARNNRQLQAKAAFERIIGDAYMALGAAFFVKLDATRPGHPGWWYRRPIVALLALENLEGQAACSRYMKQQADARFPDCGVPLPLKTANYGAVRSRHAQRTQSRSMWAYSHELAPAILREMAVLQAEHTGTAEPDKEPESRANSDCELGALLGWKPRPRRADKVSSAAEAQ